jgi:hypothetical protein
MEEALASTVRGFFYKRPRRVLYVSRRPPPKVHRASACLVLAALASHPPQCFQIAFHKLHDELIVAGVTPAIAVNAADQHLTVVIDFH